MKIHNITIPKHVAIKRCPVKTARGAYKPKTGCIRGSASSATIYASADRASLLNRAARGGYVV
jgi:hypothetical protein